MRSAPRRACLAVCPHFVPCPVHSRKSWADRRSISRQHRGYDAEHEKLRRKMLGQEPVCRACRRLPATVADHIVPLARGGKPAFGNYQALCVRCSRAKSAREGALGVGNFGLGTSGDGKTRRLGQS